MPLLSDCLNPEPLQVAFGDSDTSSTAPDETPFATELLAIKQEQYRTALAVAVAEV